MNFTHQCRDTTCRVLVLILDIISSQINVSELQAGIYIIEIDGKAERFVKL